MVGQEKRSNLKEKGEHADTGAPHSRENIIDRNK